jgi:hypothetical protein
MEKRLARTAFVVLACTIVFGLGACDEREQAYYDLDQETDKWIAYEYKNRVEFDNYNAAHELYDSPNTIIWCTTAWSNPSAPLLTVPIKGKLTSSSVSFYANQSSAGVEQKSIDGMYHGSPPPYRFGFTPGGQYVDFSGMEVFCTTSLSKFQRESTEVSVKLDENLQDAQAEAEEALETGNPEEAQRILERALEGGQE